MMHPFFCSKEWIIGYCAMIPNGKKNALYLEKE